MNLMRLVFSFHGRMGRAQFLYVNIALGVVLFVLGTLASVFAPDQVREPIQLLPILPIYSEKLKICFASIVLR